MIPPLDYDVRALFRLMDQCKRALGHECSKKEFDDWQRGLMEREAEIFDKSEKERKKKLREEEERIKQRGNEICKRISIRSNSPEEYIPPTNINSLKEASMLNMSYAERTFLVGTEENPIQIDLDLEGFNFSNAIFNNVTFNGGCNLNNSIFKGANFNNVFFDEGVSLIEADFDSAEFHDVIFSYETKIEGSSFRFSKFRKGVFIEFDRNYIANATFDFRRSDVWANLSRSYAGIWQYINITLSGIYFGIILLQLYFFKLLTSFDSAFQSHEINYCGNNECVEISAFRFIFGDGFFTIAAATAIMILIYQSLRLYITMNIAPLIEIEKRTGYTPDRSSYIGFSKIKSFVRFLGAIVVLMFFYEIWSILVSKIMIPLPSIGVALG